MKVVEWLNFFAGDDIVEVFGDSGVGKSKMALKLATDAIAEGSRVRFFDSERNLAVSDMKSLGSSYQYLSSTRVMIDYVSKLRDVDLIIIDSIGFPVLVSYARMTARQRGEALLELIALLGALKEACERCHACALVTNQPESGFMKEPGYSRRPFGQKAQFAAKEIWSMRRLRESDQGHSTVSLVEVFRSRSIGNNLPVCRVEISSSGVKIHRMLGEDSVVKPEGEPVPKGKAEEENHKGDEPKIDSFLDLEKECFNRWLIQPNEVYRLLGVRSRSTLGISPQECFKTIKFIKAGDTPGDDKV